MEHDVKDEIRYFKIGLYTGEMESLEEIVRNLKLENHQYHFDVITKYFYIQSRRLLLSPGDHYEYEIEKNEKEEIEDDK